ncbi:hypothetical protein CY35_16G033900 [Sphagnum magellanicum]|nr:hypothetical protein CY35_16G033900 [Sphagnum magellanicum]KAH9537099.1 hypothetical protein CY35_16G033900 [Sphagnum magellanicum]
MAAGSRGDPPQHVKPTTSRCIAVEGCAHGDLDNIYATLQYLEHTNNIKIELLICCGDFQAVRNEDDLESLSCPPKYRAMNSFWKYYSGAEIAPFPTLFVGGNHEASNYLWELYYGGFVAPNIYFLGFAGVVQFGGIRIGGLSGIYKDHDFHKGHFERAPYNKDNIKSVYHVRQYDVLKLMEVRGAIDIFVSHDWPRGITKYGDAQQLLRQKPHFQQDIETNQLGSKAGEQLLHALKPLYWFSAHLHTKFSALVPHPGGHHPTKFLALDKCLPRRNFLQVIDIPGGAGPLEFRYDEEWLAITRAYHFLLPLNETPAQIGRMQAVDLMAHQHWVEKRLAEKGYAIPTEFYMTAPAYSPNGARHRGGLSPGHMRNPQTEEFLRLLELPYLLDCKTAPPIPLDSQEYMASLPKVLQTEGDPNEIPLEDDKDDSQDMLDDVNGLEESSGLEFNDPNEIVLEDEDNEQYHST